MQPYNLINVVTEDDIKLNGLYIPGDKSKSACIFIHGFTTDFYSHKFFHTISESLKKQSNAIILAQTRGTGIQTEFLKSSGDNVYIGSFYEKLEEAHLDISSYADFLFTEGYKSIVLIGHSLGTIKSVRYLFEGKYKDKVSKLVLLAPFDKNAFMEVKAPGKWAEFLTAAQKKISEGKGKELVPVPEYEDFSMSYDTFYSWYKEGDLSSMWDFYRKDYNFPIMQKINIPTKVILGEKDEFVAYKEFGSTPADSLNIMKKYIKECETVLIKDSTHCYVGYEDRVAKEVSNFL